MKHHLPSLDALKVFEAAARHLSFSLAAQELCLTKGAVSYQIRKLEESLDCALFRRAVRQVYLTEAGQQLLQTAQQLFTELDRTLERIAPADSGTDVIIGATTYVATRWLLPRIAEFSERHPETSVILQHSVNDDDFRLQEVDFAIRWCEMEGQNRRGRPLEVPMSLYPVCSPRLLERVVGSDNSTRLPREALARPPLDATPLLCEVRSLDLWDAWYSEGQQSMPNPRRYISDSNVRAQAAIDGLGWTLADAMMQAEIERGQLVSPFDHLLDGYGYALQVAPGRYVSQGAAELKNWLIEHA
jgi:LysR family glycine cleavage system transcriptional activator